MRSEKLSRQQLSQTLGVSVSTIRRWDNVFAEWLIATPGKRGVQKQYETEDIITFKIIKLLRNKSKPYTEIKIILAEELFANSSKDAFDKLKGGR